MQVNEIPEQNNLTQEIVKTFLADSAYMDIYSDGFGVTLSNGDLSLTITDLIHPPEAQAQVGKILVAEWVCLLQIGGNSTARILAVLAISDKEKPQFEENLKDTTGKLNISIDKTIVDYEDSKIETRMMLDSKMVKAYFIPTKDFLQPSWSDDPVVRYGAH